MNILHNHSGNRWISVVFALTFLPCSLGAVAGSQGAWIGTWASSPAGLPADAVGTPSASSGATLVKGTIRYRLRVSQGGRSIRLRFSNEYGSAPFSLTAATVGLANAGLDAVPGSLKRVTFGGNASINIPAGAPVLSDPVALPIKSLGDVVVSVYARDGMAVFACPATDHSNGQAVVTGSDATDSEQLPVNECRYTIRPIVSAVAVWANRPGKVAVALGDSITDGALDPKTGERGWPGALSRRLRSSGVSVVNAGIGGNRLLQSMPANGAAALSRLDRDVLSVPGVSHVVLLEGINDIRYGGADGMFGDTPQVSAQDLIGAYIQIIERAHVRGVKVVGATLLPFEAARFYSAAREQIRAAANEWIRTSKSFDGVVDFDAAMHDPAAPGKLKPEYDSGDHIHPSPAGYRHMGDVIDLGLFN
jgi:lysophospholipase L1-like esterase